ncbi:MAG: spermidine/putrescine ABC transporter substrate-binding protein [Clostridia bacterium]|nr:spermidine/putrescine ABC transporter substrate-binding protein [Clostridia bacterium]
MTTKKRIALLVALLMVFSCLFTVGCGSDDSKTLNILNWGDYIDPELIEQFEEEYNVTINYSELPSNEEMLIKLRSSDNIYDLCFPSDYMIEKLLAEDLIAPLNKDNIPNLANIDAEIMDIAASFDEGNTYSVPYMWGTVGILYNTTMVDEPVSSWNILWDEKYAGQILMYDSVRDSIAVSLIRLGYDINTRNADEVKEAADELIWQKQNVLLAYGTDDIKTTMINGKAALAVIYSGDAFYCCEENTDLAYAVPEEGSNIWFDNIVIPKSSDNKELAEQFINFLCDAEVARQNTEYIYYSTPNAEALKLLDAYFTENETYNPSEAIRSRCAIFHDLGDFTDVFNTEWERLKTS